jgi:hypothetical protein
MDHREEAERVVGIAMGVVELGVSLALLPVKLALRAVRPAPAEDDRWVPTPVRPAASPSGTPAKGYAETAVGVPPAPAPAAAAPAAPAPAPAPAQGDRPDADEGRSGSLGAKLRVDAPWEGYDAQNVAAIVTALRGADPAQRAIVRLYEETHKNRAGVLRATE